MRKFRFIDEDEGTSYEVEEIEETETPKVEESAEDEDVSLSSDEINALKRLAAVADKLIAMCEVGDEEEEVEEKEEEEVEDAQELKEEEEKVVETDACKDSMKAFGAIEKRITDSDDCEDVVSNAWAKRYGGK